MRALGFWKGRHGALSLGLLAMASLLGGCEDDLTPITFIEQLDLLGVRAEVVGDTGRNRPRPGETYTFSPILAWPERDPDLSQLSTLVVHCTASDFVNVFPVCLELLGDNAVEAIDTEMAPDNAAEAQLECDGPLNLNVAGLGLHCALGLPTFTLQMPTTPEMIDGEFRDRLIVGVTCNGGYAALTLEPESPFGCVARDGEAPVDEVQFFGTVAFERQDGDVNNNPEPDSLDVRLLRPDDDDAETWPRWTRSDPPQADACTNGSALELPEVSLEEEVDIEFRYATDAIETIDGERETIEVSSYVNAGELERRFTVFREDDDPASAQVLTWTAPSRTSLEDLERRQPDDPIRFTMVVRDGFDGVSSADYYLCLVPKED